MTNHWSDLRNADVVMIPGANPAANHPISWRWVEEARDKRGAKVICIDPRFSRTASKADVYAPIRPGTNIVFTGALINYAIRNNYIQWEYVMNYTNAPLVVTDAYSFDPETGLYNGYDEGKRVYPADERKNLWNVVYKDEATHSNPIRVPLVDVEDMANARGKPTGWTTPGDPKTCPVNRNHPDYHRTVFAKLEEHYSRYTPELVEKVCGMSREQFEKAAEAYCGGSYKPEKAATIMYAMGLAHFSLGVQNIRGYALLQLLLGNIGVPGGGVNAMRGESNVQASTDMGQLYHNLPGYIAMPTDAQPTLADFNAAYAPDKISGYYTNRHKWMGSLLKCWWPGIFDEQGAEAAYACVPKLVKGKDYSWTPLFEDMYQGIIKGMISLGMNSPVSGPNANMECAAMDKLDWLVVSDLWDTEMMNYWRRPGADPKGIPTKVFSLPAACHLEKSGTLLNSGKVFQFRWKAVEPPGEARTDLYMADALMTRLKKLYEDEGGPAAEAITGLFWDYERDEDGQIDIDNIAVEASGFKWPANAKDTADFWEKARAGVLTTFGDLKEDGSTASHMWAWGGCYASIAKNDDGSFKDSGLNYLVNKAKVISEAEATKQENRYKAKWQYQLDPNPISEQYYGQKKPGLGLYPYWGYDWPLNRRIIYNRCSADYSGKPWAEDKALVAWKDGKWINNDVPDFVASDAVTKAPNTPQDTASGLNKGPFIMVEWKDSQLGLLFTNKLAEGPFPEHYEPRESPVKNIVNGQQWCPAVKSEWPSAVENPDLYGFAEVGDQKYPYVCTSFHITEHWQSGSQTRCLSWLGEAMPENFVEISQSLAKKIGVKKGDIVEVESKRGKMQAVAVVTSRLQPFKISDGNGGTKEVEVVGTLFHYGFTGMYPGGRDRPGQGGVSDKNYACNQMTPHVIDASASMPEFKAFLCDIKKVS